MTTRLSILTAALFATTLAPTVVVGAGTGLPRIEPIELRGLDGEDHGLFQRGDAKATVLVFVGHDCPVSNAYVPTINDLVETYSSKGVAVYGVYPDPNLEPGDAAKHREEYRLRPVMLLDPEQVAASAAGVTRVPEAVVVSPTGQVTYRGRIDDRFSADGRRRDRPTKRELAGAIEATLAGKNPDPAQTTAFGCLLPDPIPKPRPETGSP